MTPRFASDFSETQEQTFQVVCKRLFTWLIERPTNIKRIFVQTGSAAKIGSLIHLAATKDDHDDCQRKPQATRAYHQQQEPSGSDFIKVVTAGKLPCVALAALAIQLPTLVAHGSLSTHAVFRARIARRAQYTRFLNSRVLGTVGAPASDRSSESCDTLGAPSFCLQNARVSRQAA